MEKQTITNETTNEQFSVETEEQKEFPGFFTVKIKRGMKNTNKMNESENPKL